MLSAPDPIAGKVIDIAGASLRFLESYEVKADLARSTRNRLNDQSDAAVVVLRLKRNVAHDTPPTGDRIPHCATGCRTQRFSHEGEEVQRRLTRSGAEIPADLFRELNNVAMLVDHDIGRRIPLYEAADVSL